MSLLRTPYNKQNCTCQSDPRRVGGRVSASHQAILLYLALQLDMCVIANPLITCDFAPGSCARGNALMVSVTLARASAKARVGKRPNELA